MTKTRVRGNPEKSERQKVHLTTKGDILNAQDISFGKEIKWTTVSSLNEYATHTFPEQRYVVDEVGLRLKGDGEERVKIVSYSNEDDIQSMCDVMASSLSEPYNIWVYRFFVEEHPDLTYLAFDRKTNKCVAAIMAKTLLHEKNGRNEGYIGMLAVDPTYRRIGLASRLVRMVLDVMRSHYNCFMCHLDTEITNIASLKLYESFGFIRDCRFEKYYMNGSDAFRLRLLLQPRPAGTNKEKDVYYHKPLFDFKGIRSTLI